LRPLCDDHRYRLTGLAQCLLSCAAVANDFGTNATDAISPHTE